jgi:lipoprotein-releasing system ATP-binding protein
MLSLTNVTKYFETARETVQVLNNVSFTASPGQSLAITGPSGSGKSTLLHLIGTLDRPSTGQIEMGGKDPFDLPEPDLARFRNQEIGFVFQDHHLLPQYSVMENILMPTLAFGSSNGEDAERARDLVDRVGLSHRVEHRPGELSGGERQRVAVARALINSPSVLLCDEPTGSLDQTRAAEISGFLFELHREAGNILIVVTHSHSLAARFERHFELEEGTCAEV